MERIPTGITILDKRLGGGLPAGTMVCIFANPIAMPEVFLHQFASIYTTFYFTTVRPAKYVRENIESMGFDVDHIEFIDVFEKYYLSETGAFVVEDMYRDRNIFDFVDAKLSEISTEKHVIIIFDNLSFFLKLNVPVGLKEWLINKIYVTTKNVEGLSYCYVIKNIHPKDLESLVIDLSDAVFDIDVERHGDRIVNRLAIPKVRNMQPITETFRYYISEGVQIDTSRDIA
ncbi:RAD55 family ATPase [Ferroglobus sp.]|uniref:RAD55 family ATPase n=1 Tax=Ferroglobus sp. TaxID=2614230 RepID=UPI0025B9295F|nr:RAD55 family ATPase [Ferroglobus sp.]